MKGSSEMNDRTKSLIQRITKVNHGARVHFSSSYHPWWLIGLVFILYVVTEQTGTAEPADSSNEDEATLIFEPIEDSGLNRQVSTSFDLMTILQSMTGGVAAADIDNDGDVDLYVVGADDEPNALYINDGSGEFHDIAAEVGVDFLHWGSGPAFGDIDGDGDLDLFVGGVEGAPFYLLENRIDGADSEGRFVDITEESGMLLHSDSTVSATFVDYDQDGRLDILLTHWGDRRHLNNDTETLWRNEGGNLFTNLSNSLGISDDLVEDGIELTLTANLFDVSGDGLPDLLMAADSNESQTFIYNGNSFVKSTNREVIKDQAGMGAAVGDYDNDGDFDWFVTSVYDLHVGGAAFGNRMYQNDGQGIFSDVTDEAGVADGNWGWAACMKDFDHDGDLDIFHVNGWDDWEEYRAQPSRFFQNLGDGSFRNVDVFDIGIIGRGQGRALACFDADRDGDIDLLVVNLNKPHLVLYRNDSTNLGNYVVIKLRGSGSNTFGIGALVSLTTSTGKQIRQLGASNNYLSHNPFEVHFGLDQETTAEVQVDWMDGSKTVSHLSIPKVNQVYTIEQPAQEGLQLTVQFGDGDGIYAVGDSVEISAVEPADGYYFSHWTISGGTISDPYASATTFVMPNSGATVTAYFLPGVSPSAAVSAARRWNEVLLAAVRNDYARPTVHARNLFHISAAQYDSWAVLVRDMDPVPKPWLVGNTEPITCPLEDLSPFDFDESDIETALSYASFRLIRHRFSKSPGLAQIIQDTRALMSFLDLDSTLQSTDYTTGDAFALGNYIASCYMAYGEQDGANEDDDYKNKSYTPVNPALEPHLPGNPNIVNLNRWQPLKLESFIDQAGNEVDEPPEFLSPEWGSVASFALTDVELQEFSRVGEDYVYQVYHDPGAPPTIDGVLTEEYKWSHSLVSIWSSHLDPKVGRGADLVDISPNGIGNIAVDRYPLTFPEHRNFYTVDGLDPGTGYSANPATGAPYQPQIVPLGDYARVLAEFWADGPDSETPPGHWFVILNTVNDHPDSTRKLRGVGHDRTELEWDVISYFVLGGAMHDAAITAWGIKGWYDYVRPISSIRAMADRGQSSNLLLPSYHAQGIPLRTGYVELVDEEDELAGDQHEHVGKIKLWAWRGPDYIDNPVTDVAGVGWILAENWWPYQRPTFVTPPFAGYVSGHSTYSRAAAEALTALTGSSYFPGGMSDFEVEKDSFLVFERGPSVSLTLQWATYQDASDQCSLSRIWGGIHPPIDDIPGRLIGITIGQKAFEHAMKYVEPDKD